MKRTICVLLALVAGVCVVTACAKPQSAPAPLQQAEPITPPMEVLVDNRGFYDANVYVLVSHAIVRKLGTVEGFTTRHFLLVGSQFAPGQSVALYAKTIAEAREYTSGAFSVYAGMGMRWTLDSHGTEWLVPMSQAAAASQAAW